MGIKKICFALTITIIITAHFSLFPTLKQRLGRTCWNRKALPLLLALEKSEQTTHLGEAFINMDTKTFVQTSRPMRSSLSFTQSSLNAAIRLSSLNYPTKEENQPYRFYKISSFFSNVHQWVGHLCLVHLAAWIWVNILIFQQPPQMPGIVAKIIFTQPS